MGDPAHMMQIQHKIRRDAELQAEMIGDLRDWHKTIQAKDNHLRGRTKAPAPRGVRKVPPVRGHVPVRGGAAASSGADEAPSAVEAKPAPKPAPKPKSGSAASHTYDKGYKKWESFDVDAALKEDEDEADAVEGAAAPPPPSGAPVTPATMLRPPTGKRKAPKVKVAKVRESDRKSREQLEREDGNKRYKAGDFNGAVKCYTRCIALNTANAVAYSNRAMAYLKLKLFDKAEEDCTSALRISPGHVKSLMRRGTARNALGRHRAAVADLESAVAAEPSNKQANTELRKARELRRAAMKKAPRVKIAVKEVNAPESRPAPASTAAPAPAPAPGGAVPAAAAPESKGPLISVVSKTKADAPEPMGDAGDDVDAAEPDMEPVVVEVEAAASSEAAAHRAPTPPTAGSAPPATAPVELAPPAAEVAPAAATEEVAPPAATAKPIEAPAPHASVPAHDGAGRADAPSKKKRLVIDDSDSDSDGGPDGVAGDEATSAPGSGGATAAEGTVAAGATESKSSDKTPGEEPVAPRTIVVPVSVPSSAPKNRYEFESSWRVLGSKPELRARYLEDVVLPSSLLKLYKTAMEADQLVTMFEALRLHGTRPKRALNIAKAISKTPEFSITKMFLTDDDKSAVAAYFEDLVARAGEADSGVTKAAVGKVQSAFK